MELVTLLLFSVVSLLFYLTISALRAFLRPSIPAKVVDLSPRVGDITLEELSKYTGEDPFRPILFSVRGRIYNVTSARNFYGPGGAYQTFAGREIARALGKMAIKDEECTAEVGDLTERERTILEDWEKKFQEKYEVVGHVVPDKLLSLRELSEYDGRDDTKPILLAVRGVIFDVSQGRDFYGPDGAYPFGGKECSRALAKFSTELAGVLPSNSLWFSTFRSSWDSSASDSSRTLSCRAQSKDDVKIRFQIKRRIEFGERHKIVGDHPVLGEWDASRGLEMSWRDGDEWSVEALIPSGTSLAFKCVQVGERGESVVWEDGDNRYIQTNESLEVVLCWNEDMKVSGHEGNGKPQLVMEDEDRDVRRKVCDEGRMKENDAISNQVEESIDELQEATTKVLEQAQDRMSSTDDDFLTVIRRWDGRDTVFMRANEHASERSGIWNSDNLGGPALMLVEGDKAEGNWLGKLKLAKKVLVDEAPRMRPDLEALAYAFVYLTWVASGTIPCVESGGHYRPNHHARIAQMTFRSLEWVIGDKPSSPEALIARRLHTKIPSFTDSFTQSTPLTRIRDIAHRNDIPHELKQEIKHTIQNKLHRNAGPEDLIATETLLERIEGETDKDYSESFVSELRLFLSELRDFFNAGTLTDLLTAVLSSLGDADARLIEHFLAAKATLDGSGNAADDNRIMDALHGATSVRALLASGLSSGLRNDASDRAMAMRQRWRLAEIRTEDYVFMLMSRFINGIEDRGGAEALVNGSDGTWALPIGTLVIGLRHIGLSGYNPSECMAIECELGSWQRFGNFSDPDAALRLRATLQRLMRLTASYTQTLLDSLMSPAETLGGALGLEPERAKFVAESEIRSSVVFQLSKLASILLDATRTIAGVSPWDVIVAGESSGMLKEVRRLEPGCLDDVDAKKGAILVVESATGDEEVGTLGQKLKGIVLRQQIPHLSHLGVRARQEDVPFVATDDNGALDTVCHFVGQDITMAAHPDNVTFAKYDEDVLGKEVANASDVIYNGTGGADAAERNAFEKNSKEVEWTHIDVQKVQKAQIVRLAEAERSYCGAKAAACRELLILADECSKALHGNGSDTNADTGPIFRAPDGVCLPFGSMELLLKAEGKEQKLDELLLLAEAAAAAITRKEHEPSSADHFLDGLDSKPLGMLCKEIHSVIASLSIPENLLQSIKWAFESNQRVIVRSSANVEDLAGFSSAGLYESIVNVDPHQHTAIEDAIKGVWSSLYSRRAILARSAASLPHGSATMAVLIQAQLVPEYSFVLHTVHPQKKGDLTIVAEIAPGLGETLAAATEGSGWRIHIDRETGSVSTESFANFSKAFMPKISGLDGKVSSKSIGALSSQIMDYSRLDMSLSRDFRSAVGARLGVVARLLEAEFGCPQDIEGCIAQGQLFIVQTRPQM